MIECCFDYICFLWCFELNIESSFGKRHPAATSAILRARLPSSSAKCSNAEGPSTVMSKYQTYKKFFFELEIDGEAVTNACYAEAYLPTLMETTSSLERLHVFLFNLSIISCILAPWILECWLHCYQRCYVTLFALFCNLLYPQRSKTHFTL